MAGVTRVGPLVEVWGSVCSVYRRSDDLKKSKSANSLNLITVNTAGLLIFSNYPVCLFN